MPNKLSILQFILALLFALSTANASSRTDVVIGMQLEPPHLDPTSAAAGAIDQVLYANVYEGLTRFAADGSIIPALAKSWVIADDGLSYHFTLHENVHFHNGDLMTSADVKFSLDRARGDESTNAQKNLFKNIHSIATPSPLEVVITLKTPNGLFLFNLAWGDAVIVNKNTIADIANEANGTGPFKVKQWIKGDRISLGANENYWGIKPALKSATFRFISDPTAGFAAIKAGDIDAFPAFPAPETLSLFADDPRFQVISGSTEGETILAMNNKVTPLNDKRVREAITHALDRRTIIDGAMFGYGQVIGTHFAPHHPDYIDLTALSTYNPSLSRQLLEEAGYADGFELQLKLPPPSYARRSGEIIAAQLRAIGITTKIENLEWAQWLEKVFRNKDYDLTVISHTEPFDIDIYGRDDYYFQYSNPDFKALLKQLSMTVSPLPRQKILHQLQTIIAEDYVNAYLFQLPQVGVIKAGLKGLWENAPTQAIDLTGVYWQ